MNKLTGVISLTTAVTFAIAAMPVTQAAFVERNCSALNVAATAPISVPANSAQSITLVDLAALSTGMAVGSGDVVVTSGNATYDEATGMLSFTAPASGSMQIVVQITDAVGSALNFSATSGAAQVPSQFVDPPGSSHEGTTYIINQFASFTQGSVWSGGADSSSVNNNDVSSVYGASVKPDVQQDYAGCAPGGSAVVGMSWAGTKTAGPNIDTDNYDISITPSVNVPNVLNANPILDGAQNVGPVAVGATETLSFQANRANSAIEDDWAVWAQAVQGPGDGTLGSGDPLSWQIAQSPQFTVDLSGCACGSSGVTTKTITVNVDDGTGGGGGDSDGDGVPDDLEGDGDADGDGIPNVGDLDSDNDGIPDGVEHNAVAGPGLTPGPDADGDGIPNMLDLDSDNDTIPDIYESGVDNPASLDADGNGQIDDNIAVGDNGLADVLETAPDSGDINYEVADTDGDGSPDFVDLDSDGDGIFDIVEGGNGDLDQDGDGMIDGGNVGEDGIDDDLQPGGDGTSLDPDGDGVINIIDNQGNVVNDNTVSGTEIETGLTGNGGGCVMGQGTSATLPLLLLGAFGLLVRRRRLVRA